MMVNFRYGQISPDSSVSIKKIEYNYASNYRKKL